MSPSCCARGDVEEVQEVGLWAWKIAKRHHSNVLSAALRFKNWREVRTGQEHEQSNLSEQAVRVLDEAAKMDIAYRSLPDLIVAQPGGNSPEVLAVARAFTYTIVNPASSVEKGQSAFTPPVQPGEATSIWDAAASRCSSPTIRSTLNHLLFELGVGTRHEHARAAADAYVEIAEAALPLVPDRIVQRLEHASAADWGHELYRRMGDVEGQTRAVIAILNVLEQELGGGLNEAGIIMPLLERLVKYSPTEPTLPALLDRTRSALKENRWQLQRVIQLQQLLASDDPRRVNELRRDEVEVLIADAESASGIGAQIRLESAAQRAANLGLRDLEERASRMLQDLPRDELGLVPVGSTIEIPREEFVARKEGIATSSDVSELLARLAGDPPPSGDLTETNRRVEASSAEPSLLNSAVGGILDDDWLPTFSPRTVEEEQDAAMAFEEVPWMLALATAYSSGLAEALARLDPTEDDIVAAISALSVVESTARTIARSLLAFGAGRYEEAASLALIRVESQVRGLAEQAGTLRYQTQQGARRGQYPQLGTLLDGLRNRLDPSWWRFLESFLVGPAGLNYRNRLFHGHVKDVDDRYSALSIVAVAYVARPTSSVLLPEHDGDIDS